MAFRYFNFNPRATYVARREVLGISPEAAKFQSTRHLRGATMAAAKNAAKQGKFQSTRHLRGATVALYHGGSL